jgi:hypothetical protein
LSIDFTVRIIVGDFTIFASSDTDIPNVGKVLKKFIYSPKAKIIRKKALGLGSWRKKSLETCPA